MSYGSGYGGGYGGSSWPDGIRVEIDWDRVAISGTGTYVDGYSDVYGPSTVSNNVTALVRPIQGAVTAEYGRDQVTALAPTVSGRGSLVLDNRDRRFSPRAATLANGTPNPLYGKIKPARPVHITRTISATDYVLFDGHTDDNPINPDPDSKTVSITLVDRLADFRGQTITTRLYSGIRTGQAIGYILDACGIPAADRDLDPGATIIPWWWADGKDALTALEEIIRSEGPPALLTIGVNGAIVFKDRHHRLLDPASITSQGTWRGSGVLEPVMQRGFVYNESWANIVNTGTATVDVRTPQELQQVWTNDSLVSLSAGEQKLVTASTTDPFYGAIAPVTGTDYTLLSGTVTTALTNTSGTSAAIILTAGGAGAVISNLQLRAQPVTVAYSVQVSSSDSTSIGSYGSRSFPGDLPWCGPDDAQAVLETTVSQRSQPLPVVSARFVIGNNLPKAAAILSRDLSDRVTVVEPETVLNNDFYVESIAHELTGTFDHAVTFGLELAPTLPSNIFQLDVAGHGADQGILGGGFDDPASLFILDSTVAGHRLDEGYTAH
jgi:hypothetical protein